MTRYVALLRGINLGGNRKIRMADLRSIFNEARCSNVTTYIQSGNVVFTDESRSTDDLRVDLEQRIEETTGIAVPIVLRSAEEWAAVVRANPYEGVEPTKLHVAFLGDRPPADPADVLRAAARPSEEFTLAGSHVYMHLPDGMGRAELPKGLERLETTITVRNWKTVTKLAELSS
jgi:uncharacterized protein (DUF1697 family)